MATAATSGRGGQSVAIWGLLVLSLLKIGLERWARAIVMLALMGVGAIGLAIATEWMARGEPSEQFTRTRWFRRPAASPIAD